MNDLAYRMKANYENRQRFYLTRRTPVIVRVEGKAFHTFTRNLQKPFDENFIDGMQYAARYTAEQMQGCKLVFVQSDEASFLLTDYDSLQTEAWFDYNLQKMVSVAAASMSTAFHLIFNDGRVTNLPIFDARAFNIPREEATNYFLWRAKDWHRNSVMMYAQSFFSHNAIEGKSIAELHEMLYGIGKNWATDLLEHLRNGLWYVEDHWRSDILPSFDSINAVVEPFIAEKHEVALPGLDIDKTGEAQERPSKKQLDRLELIIHRVTDKEKGEKGPGGLWCGQEVVPAPGEGVTLRNGLVTCEPCLRVISVYRSLREAVAAQ